MQTNAQIRIYSAGYLPVQTSYINSRTKFEICSKLKKASKKKKKRKENWEHENNEMKIIKTWK